MLPGPSQRPSQALRVDWMEKEADPRLHQAPAAHPELHAPIPCPSQATISPNTQASQGPSTLSQGRAGPGTTHRLHYRTPSPVLSGPRAKQCGQVLPRPQPRPLLSRGPRRLRSARAARAPRAPQQQPSLSPGAMQQRDSDGGGRATGTPTQSPMWRSWACRGGDGGPLGHLGL